MITFGGRNKRSVYHRYIGSQKKGCCAFLFIIVIIVVYAVCVILLPEGDDSCIHGSFQEALNHHASSDMFIVLAMVDVAFVDMALNLYYTSLLPHNINNFLFVGAGLDACNVLQRHSIACFMYTDIEDSEKASRYQSKSFIRKMNIRTEMIIEALNQGYTVLHTDLDMTFIRNPILELKQILQSADIATLQDGIYYNAGFLVVRPSDRGIEVYQRVKRITNSSMNIDDQSALNEVLKVMQKKYSPAEFSVVKLQRQRFLCGMDYFEHGNRMFAGDKFCWSCSVVHNNWIVGREAKIYRLKELHMWMVDRDQYYTNPNQKYLVYDNPIDDWDSDANATTAELNALKTALAIGQITGRVVILPRFHCGKSNLRGTAISMKYNSNPRQLYKSYIRIVNTSILYEPGQASNCIKNPSDFQRHVTPSKHTVDLSVEDKISSTDQKSSKKRRECPLNALLDMTAFDKEFGGFYRESSFLTHPLVNIPAAQYSQAQLIFNSFNKNLISKLIPQFPTNKTNLIKGLQIFVPLQNTGDSAISEQAIVDKYGSRTSNKTLSNIQENNSRILIFHSLYNVKVKFTNNKVGNEFEARVKRAFKRRTYRQY